MVSSIEQFVCKECDAEFDTERSLHSHFRKHSMAVGNYYVKHFNRRDLFTGEPIPFKTKEKYFEQDFISKITMRKWLKNQPREIVQNYCRDILVKRIEKKGLVYAPMQVEMRSTMLPPVSFYEEIFGDYETFCAELGLKSRFTDFELRKANTDCIYVDSREQSPLSFNFPIQISKLEWGDYWCNGSNLYWERKSLPDMISSFGAGFDRISNEIERAQYNGAQLVFIIESSLTNALSFNHLPWISKKIKATPELIFHNIRVLCQRYPNIQFLFVDGRKEAVRVIEKIYTNNLYNRDYQLEYDSKGI